MYLHLEWFVYFSFLIHSQERVLYNQKSQEESYKARQLCGEQLHRVGFFSLEKEY